MKNAKTGFSTAAIFVLTATLLGCASRKIIFPVAPSDTKANSLVLKAGKFETASNKYKADFGTLVVPENRDKAGSRLIELPVIRIHASGSNPTEPIFYLQGGPGQSNTRFRPPDDLLSNHDFVMVGYRGVDGSMVLQCPEAQKALKGNDEVLSEKALKKIGEAFASCLSRLKKEGVDLDGYTMMEVIEDLEAARVALSYKRIHLLSCSYGTRLAYIYGLKHPDSIYRSAMIGVNPPGHFGWEPETVDAQLKYYADLWAKDPKMSARTPDLLATMRQVAHNMPRRWLFFPINPDKVKIMTFFLLYHRDTAAMVFDAYVAAEKGDASGLALMSMAYDFMPSTSIWGEFILKGVSAEFDSSRDYFTEMDPPNSILGSPVGKLLWGSVQFGNLPIKKIPEEFRKVQPSDVETLLISGSIDFSTPAEFAAKELLPYLSKGKQVILSEMGHCDDVWKVQREATRLLLTSFYDTGVPNDSLFVYQPMDFDTKLKFPKLAKLVLVTNTVWAAMVIVGLVSFISFIF